MVQNKYKRHYYHIVDRSPWPIFLAFSLFMIALGAARWFHYMTGGYFLLIGVLMTIFILFLWWRDVVREGTFEGKHTIVVQKGLRLGFVLFILSEVMFFFSFFWAFFNASLAPDIALGCVWPPVGICTFDPRAVPLVNTVLLVTSGATITWAHYALLSGKYLDCTRGFIVTLVLGFSFTLFQVLEYLEAPFSISDIYGTTFFVLTGFHGLHVIIGACFISVCYFRYRAFHFTRRHHLGFEFAAWYWHFVDVVWLFLYLILYYWSNLS